MKTWQWLLICAAAGGIALTLSSTPATAEETAEVPPPLELKIDDTQVIIVNPATGGLVQVALAPDEKILAKSTTAAFAVIITNQRALGYSLKRGSYIEIRLAEGERPTSISDKDNTIRVETGKRVLIFDSNAGTWAEE